MTIQIYGTVILKLKVLYSPSKCFFFGLGFEPTAPVFERSRTARPCDRTVSYFRPKTAVKIVWHTRTCVKLMCFMSCNWLRKLQEITEDDTDRKFAHEWRHVQAKHDHRQPWHSVSSLLASRITSIPWALVTCYRHESSSDTSHLKSIIHIFKNQKKKFRNQKVSFIVLHVCNHISRATVSRCSKVAWY
jgi:hypothetical protein